MYEFEIFSLLILLSTATVKTSRMAYTRDTLDDCAVSESLEERKNRFERAKYFFKHLEEPIIPVKSHFSIILFFLRLLLNETKGFLFCIYVCRSRARARFPPQPPRRVDTARPALIALITALTRTWRSTRRHPRTRTQRGAGAAPRRAACPLLRLRGPGAAAGAAIALPRWSTGSMSMMFSR